jgi:hypothetical protein
MSVVFETYLSSKLKVFELSATKYCLPLSIKLTNARRVSIRHATSCTCAARIDCGRVDLDVENAVPGGVKYLYNSLVLWAAVSGVSIAGFAAGSISIYSRLAGRLSSFLGCSDFEFATAPGFSPERVFSREISITGLNPREIRV